MRTLSRFGIAFLIAVGLGAAFSPAKVAGAPAHLCALYCGPDGVAKIVYLTKAAEHPYGYCSGGPWRIQIPCPPVPSN